MDTQNAGNLTTRQLVAPQFLDPRWMNLFRGGQQDGIVNEQGEVVVHGQKLPFREISASLPAGTQVKVWVDHQFVCASVADIRAREQERQARYEEETRQNREALARRREEDLEFNRTLQLPVKWHPGIKDVVSGLTEHSDGSGRNRATVLHIRLCEDLHEGRLHRAAGDFLCTSRSGTNGMQYSAHLYEERGRVSCARCLALARKWQVTAVEADPEAATPEIPRQPRTEDVLRLIGNDGVVVGSIAEHGTSLKDVDVVVRDLGTAMDSEAESVLQRVLKAFRPSCESSAVGHLWVSALPLPVEIFGNCAWRTGDAEKDAKRLNFNQARKRSVPKDVFGVRMYVLRRST